MITSFHFLLISLFLFICGLVMMITRKNAIAILLGLELMLNAANLNFVAFSNFDSQAWNGQTMALLIMVIAACEVVLALAIIIKIYQHFKNTNLDDIGTLMG